MCVTDKSSSRADNAQNKSSSKLSSTSKSESSSRSSSTLKDSLNVRDSADDTDPSRVKTLCDSPDHISAKLNQHILSADHSAVTSNVASSVASDDSNSSNNTESAPLRTASQRPKTVKTLGSKMRSTGKHEAGWQTYNVCRITFHCDSFVVFAMMTLAAVDCFSVFIIRSVLNNLQVLMSRSAYSGFSFLVL